MRIHWVGIKGFKGLDVELPWASAVVLFGVNDSGKTNILESLTSAFTGEEDVREQPVLVGREGSGPFADVTLLVELDGLDIDGHSDRELFLSWMLADDCRHEGPPWAEARTEYARLKWGDERADAVAGLVERVRVLAREECDSWVDSPEDSESTSWPGSREEAIRSRWFLVNGDGVHWAVETEEGWCGFFSAADGQQIWEVLPIRVVSIEARPQASDPLYDRLEQLLEELSDCGEMTILRRRSTERRTTTANDPWVERSADATTLRPVIKEACARLAALANELAPRFVSDSYEIRIVPLFPDEWDRYEGRHVVIRLRPRSQEDEFDLTLASSGIATWTSYVVSEAIRLTDEELALQRSASARRAPTARTTVYIFDEPEAHLHPLAQEEAASWVAQRARTGANVVLATHAVPFLHLPLHVVEYLKVTRSLDWATTAERITGDILGAVEESASDLGLPPVALIQLTRGWLVVEGEHDRRILDAYHGRELRQAGLQILPLRGASRAKASFLNLGVLGPLGLPFFCLLDNVRAAAVKCGDSSAAGGTEEERIAEQLCRLKEERGVQVEVLGLPYPDIICALPFKAVRRAAFEHGGKPEVATSWQEMIDWHERLRAEAAEHGDKAPDFKRFVLDSLGLDSWSPDRLIDEALRISEERPEEGSALARIVSTILAQVDQRPLDLD